jgi:ADP-heptose:LPS heptosyltransferase
MVRRLTSILRNAAMTFYPIILRWGYARGRSKQKADTNNSLLLIRTDAIGDFVLFTPMLKHLRAAYGGWKITLVVNSRVFDLARTCPCADEIIPVDMNEYRSNILYRLRLIRSLRKRNLGIAVYPVYSREPLGEEILYCSGASERIGFVGDLCNIGEALKRRNDRYYSKLICIEDRITQEIARNRAFVEELTGTKLGPQAFIPEIWITEDDSASARGLLEEAGLKPGKDLIIALSPAAFWPGREWPATRYAQLADRLVNQFAAKIVICGSASDSELAARVRSQMKTSAVNLAGRTGLRHLAAMFDWCALFVGNESGPLHVAAARGVPSMCIMGGGHFGRFYPYGDENKHRMVFKKMDCYYCNWRCVYETTRCVQDIGLEHAWKATERMVKEVVLPMRASAAVK